MIMLVFINGLFCLVVLSIIFINLCVVNYLICILRYELVIISRVIMLCSYLFYCKFNLCVRAYGNR